MGIANGPVAETGMLIRRLPKDVFRSFVEPAVTTKFWFTDSSGRLEAGRRVRWDWSMYGVHVDVKVVALEEDKRILIEWRSGDEVATQVEWKFEQQPDGTTFVTIRNSGFVGSDEEKVRQAMDSTEGFSLVLAGLKGLLEHGVELNLVRDRHPASVKAAHPARENA